MSGDLDPDDFVSEKFILSGKVELLLGEIKALFEALHSKNHELCCQKTEFFDLKMKVRLSEFRVGELTTKVKALEAKVKAQEAEILSILGE